MSSASADRNVLRPGRPGALTEAVWRIWANAWLWSAGSQALTSGLSLLTSIIAARMLGVERFGDYVLIQAGVMVLSGLQYQLVGGPMVIVVGQRRRSGAYFGAITRAMLVMALLTGALAAAYSLTLDRPAGRGALMAASFLFAAGSVVQDGAKRLLFAMGRPQAAFLCELARQILFFLLLAAAWWGFGASPEMLLACIGLATALAAGPVLLPFLRSSLRGGLSGAIAARHWQLGRWLMLVVLVSMAHEQFVTIFAGAWIGEQAAAGLRAANVLLGPLLVFMSSLENVVPRRAAGHLRSGGEKALSGYLLRVLALGEVPVVAICLGIILYGRELLGLFFGPAFAGFAPVAAIIALFPPVLLARELGVTYLRATGRTYGIFIAFTASAVATLAAIYPLMTSHGVIGAAFSVVIGHTVSTLFVFAAVWRARAAIRTGSGL